MANPNDPPQPATGDEGSTAVLNDLDALRERAATAEQDRDKYLDMVKRVQADFENYQKRSARDTQQERRYAHSPLASDLLPALDNLDRAVAAARQAGDKGALVQGVAMVQSQLLDMLKRHGIVPIEAVGKPFDPNLHQAVMQKPSADVPPNTVVDVLQRGFTIHDRVLRPASVIVSSS